MLVSLVHQTRRGPTLILVVDLGHLTLSRPRLPQGQYLLQESRPPAGGFALWVLQTGLGPGLSVVCFSPKVVHLIPMKGHANVRSGTAESHWYFATAAPFPNP